MLYFLYLKINFTKTPSPFLKIIFLHQFKKRKEKKYLMQQTLTSLETLVTKTDKKDRAQAFPKIIESISIIINQIQNSTRVS